MGLRLGGILEFGTGAGGMYQQVWNTQVYTGVLQLYHKYRMLPMVGTGTVGVFRTHKSMGAIGIFQMFGMIKSVKE